MQIKVLADFSKGYRNVLVLNSNPVNLNKGLAKKVLDKTLLGLEKVDSPFVDFGVLRFECRPEADTIKITSKLNDKPEEFTIGVQKNKKNRLLYTLENQHLIDVKSNHIGAIIPVDDRNISIKEKLYTALNFLKEANKLLTDF